MASRHDGSSSGGSSDGSSRDSSGFTGASCFLCYVARRKLKLRAVIMLMELLFLR